jgi:hypothetical protein
MTVEAPDTPAASGEQIYCVRHPRRQTAVRCGKCERPICVRCMVQTPVGMRCRECAQLRKLPQYNVESGILLRSVPAGLAVSTGLWYLIGFIPFVGFWFGILVGLAIGEVMSRLAKRRSNIVLEAFAVVNAVAGFFIAFQLRYPNLLHALASNGSANSAFQGIFLLPVVLASFVAVVKVR